MIFELPDNTTLVTKNLIKESELSKFDNILTTQIVEATIKDFHRLFNGSRNNLQPDTFEKLYKVTFKPECGCEYTDKGFELEQISGCGMLGTIKLEVGLDIWYFANIPSTNMAVIYHNGLFDITEHIDIDHDCIDIRTFKYRLYKPLQLNASGFSIANEKIVLPGSCPNGSIQFLPGQVIIPRSFSTYNPSNVVDLINTTGAVLCYRLSEPLSSTYELPGIPLNIVEAINKSTEIAAIEEITSETSTYKSYDSLKTSYIGAAMYFHSEADFFNWPIFNVYTVSGLVVPGIDTSIQTYYEGSSWDANYLPINLRYSTIKVTTQQWTRIDPCTEDN